MTKKTKKFTEIILLQNIQKLGQTEKLLKVNSGYVRNYLIPNKLANLKVLTTGIENLKQKELKNFELALNHKKTLENFGKFSIKKASGKSDKIFGTVTNKHIIGAIKQKCDIPDILKVLPITIKKLGIYPVNIVLHPKVTAQIKLEVLSK